MTYRSKNTRWLLALVMVSTSAGGQSPSPTTIAVSGGVTLLTPETRLGRVPGGHVQLGISRSAHSLVTSRLRLDAGYHSIEGRASPVVATPSSNVWIVTASVVKDVGTVRGIRPYLIAGIGSTRIDRGTGSESLLSLSGGGGIVFPRVGRVLPFLEGRFHRVMPDGTYSFIPLSFGVTFQ